MLLAVAIVCDDYFLPSLEVISERKKYTQTQITQTLESNVVFVLHKGLSQSQTTVY